MVALGVVALLGWTLGCSGDDAWTGPPFRLDVPVESFFLDNGLEVVSVVNHASPLVTAVIAVRAGAFIESNEDNGASHLFEHMIFQGSSAVPDPRAFREQLDAAGALTNGTTSVDRVTYYFTVARGGLEPALSLFAGAVREPALDPALLEKERRVVLGEFDLYESDPDYLSARRLTEQMYGGTATRVDPLGSRSVVEGMGRDRLAEFHARYYVPNNSLLVLSGALEVEEARTLAEDYFGSWGRADDPFGGEPPAAAVPTLEQHFEAMSADVANSTISIRWAGPTWEYDPRGVLAGRLLSDVTYQRDHLFRGLVTGDAIFGAGLDMSVMRRAGYVTASLSVRPGREHEALQEFQQVMRGLTQPGSVSELQLETARAEAMRAALIADSSPTTLAFTLANTWARGDWREHFDELDALYAITTEDIARFAQTYLRGPQISVLLAAPESLAAGGWLEGE